MSQVVTRIPPSPTGRLHIGTARTALFNYLYAKHEGGRIVFRSEDTDKARSLKEYEDEIVEGLHWLGLDWDEFARQSERLERHKELLEKAVGEGKAYISKEPKKDDPSQEVEVVRLKNPGKEVIFEDIIRGPINTHTGELGDFVIARSINDPLYHFAVVVDDMDAGVTHVIRGEDHISNTARQILIQEAVGAPRPAYAHLPLILDANRAKLSKRSGATSLMEYKAEGFLPEAIVNYLALLGWNPGTEREDFTLDELVQTFTLEGIQKSGASWDRTKLLSVNQRWMRKLTDEEFIRIGELKTSDDKKLTKLVPLLKERAQTFKEARDMLEGDFGALFTKPTLDRETLLSQAGDTRLHLDNLERIVMSLTGELTVDYIKTALMPYADKHAAENPKEGRGAVLWPLRYALSGQPKSPDPFTLISILGKDEAISRIRKAIDIIGE